MVRRDKQQQRSLNHQETKNIRSFFFSIFENIEKILTNRNEFG
jgi:hypothetical protein